MHSCSDVRRTLKRISFTVWFLGMILVSQSRNDINIIYCAQCAVFINRSSFICDLQLAANRNSLVIQLSSNAREWRVNYKHPLTAQSRTPVVYSWILSYLSKYYSRLSVNCLWLYVYLTEIYISWRSNNGNFAEVAKCQLTFMFAILICTLQSVFESHRVSPFYMKLFCTFLILHNYSAQ